VRESSCPVRLRWRQAGSDTAYRYTGFGRHDLALLLDGNAVTLQIKDHYPDGTLDDFAKMVLDASARPELRAWRERSDP
jgi:hypothetical protein